MSQRRSLNELLGVIDSDGSDQMKILLFVLVVSISLQAQTKEDLQKKYGQPVSESYLIRPEVIVTVTYDKTGKIQEMVIAPRPAPEIIKSKPDTIKYDLLDAVIDELVPKETRGKYKMGTFLNITCFPANDCWGTSKSYEKLTIYYNAGKEGANYAVVQWDKDEAQK